MLNTKFAPLISISLLCLGASTAQALEEGCSIETGGDYIISVGGNDVKELDGCTVFKGSESCLMRTDPVTGLEAWLDVYTTVDEGTPDETQVLGLLNGATDVSIATRCEDPDDSDQYDCPTGTDALGTDAWSIKTGTGQTGCTWFDAGDPPTVDEIYFVTNKGVKTSMGEVSGFTNGRENFVFETTPQPACPQDIQDALDDGTIPGDFAIVGLIGDADTTTLCLKSGVAVFECANTEGGLPDSGLPECGDLTPNGVVPVLKRNMTTDLTKVGNTSCVFTCVPPPLTIGGRSQCGYICN